MAQWHVSRDGQQHGPYDDKTLRDLASQGRLVPTDFIWKEGMGDWVPASKLKGLFAGQSESTDAAPSAAQAAQPAATSQPKAAAPQSSRQAVARESAAVQTSASQQPRQASSRSARAATRRASSGWSVRLPMICAIAMLSTLILPWFIGEGVTYERVNGRSVRTVGTEIKMFWHMMDRSPGSFVATLIASWVLGIAAIVVTFVTTGLARTVTYASLGAAGAIFLLVLTFGEFSPFGMRGGGAAALTVLNGICLFGLVIVANVHIQRGPHKVLGLLQIIFASGVLLFAIISQILEFTDNGSTWNRARGDLTWLIKLLIVLNTVGMLTAGTLLLIHGIKRTGKSLANAGLWTIYCTVMVVFFAMFFAIIFESERWGLSLTMINMFSLIGGLIVLFCHGQVQLISRLMKRAAERAPLVEGAALAAGDAAASSQSTDVSDIEAKFAKLKQLLDHGHITQEQYDQKHAALLDQL